MATKKHVTIYTDGACIGNPGPGGYGVVLIRGRIAVSSTEVADARPTTAWS